jgi:hypothetical protein
MARFTKAQMEVLSAHHKAACEATAALNEFEAKVLAAWRALEPARMIRKGDDYCLNRAEYYETLLLLVDDMREAGAKLYR